MKYPWGHMRRFNGYPEYIRGIYGERVQKLAIDAGFTCPNRDGTKGTHGCIYCNNDAFNPSYCTSEKPVRQQLEEGIEFHQRRYRRATKYLAYFQAYTNTYAPFEELKKLFDDALSVPNITGLVIGTRPDCIEDKILDYLAELSTRYYIIVEYGIESCNNDTLKKINRGHTFGQTKSALHETSERGIRTGGHIIFGLPGESREYMLSEAAILSSLPLNNIKFHQLQILVNTILAEEYKLYPKRFNLFTLEEYLDFCISFIERLNPSIVIERIAGEVPPRFLLSPTFGALRNFEIIRMLEQKLEEKDTWQGKLFSGC